MLPEARQSEFIPKILQRKKQNDIFFTFFLVYKLALNCLRVVLHG